MRSKSVLLLTLALGCGLVASIGISHMMERRGGETTLETAIEPVFIALTPIKPNQQIKPENVKLEERPKVHVPQGALSKVDEVIGKRCKVELAPGDYIVASKLLGSGEQSAGAAGKIPKGMRVEAVKVDAMSSTAGLILPGNIVDVVVYLGSNPGQGVHDATARTIMQGIKVFAVDQATEQIEKEESTVLAKTISLLVTPAQAEMLAVASELGSLRLVLRNDDDRQDSKTMGVKISELLGGDPGLPLADHPNDKPTQGALDWLNKMAKPAAPPTDLAGDSWKMTLIQGADVKEVQFANGVPVGVDSGASAGSSPDPDAALGGLGAQPATPQEPKQKGQETN